MPRAARRGESGTRFDQETQMNTKIPTKVPMLASLCCALISSYSMGKEPAAAPEEKETKSVVLTYNEPIEGFEVTVLWRPREQMAGYVIGPAIIEFEHEDPHKTFSVTNNRFGLPDTAEWTKTATFVDGYFAKTSQPKVVLEYAKPKITDRLPSTSFFFVDLDFDGHEELVTTEIANGQRLRNTFRVYRPQHLSRRTEEVATGVPFDTLDSASRVDLNNRTIRTFNSGGAQVNEQLVYEFDRDLNRYRLKRP